MPAARRAPVAREPLSRPRILRAALDLVDAEGLDALSMRRVAAALGVEAMSLYHHVPGKEAILEGVYDLVIAKADLPTGEVTAAEWVRGTARAFRRLAQQHPRAFPLLTSRPVPLGDAAAAAPLEAGLAAFVRAGSTPAEAYAALQVVLVALLSLGLVESQMALSPDPEVASHVVELPPEQFPLLSGVPDSGIDQDGLWATLVEGLVRGLATPRGSP